MPDSRQFWTQKNPERQFQTVVFDHQDFAQPIRLVANEYTTQNFGGFTYTPVSMSRKEPEQSSDPVASASVTFPRAVVGDAFNDAIASITPSGWLSPITAEIATYWDSDRVNPSKYWLLYVDNNGITLNSTSISIKLSDENPMIRSVSVLYDVSVFTGLELQ